MSDGIGAIRGELASDIRAAGLAGLVTTVARIVYRIREFFAGLWDTLDFSPLAEAFAPVGRALSNILNAIGGLFSRVFGVEVSRSAENVRSLGSAIGSGLNVALEFLGWILGVVAQGIENFSNIIGVLISLVTGDLSSAASYMRSLFEGMGEMFARFGDLFGVGDAIREAWAEVMAFLDGINLFESGAKLISTLVEGIKSAAMAPVNAMSDVFKSVREYLPFSDAKVGPLSDLTLSGSRIPGTISEGGTQGMPSLRQAVASGLVGVGGAISEWWNNLKTPVAPTMPEPAAPAMIPIPEPGLPAREAGGERPRAAGAGGASGGNTTFNVTINGLSLPNVTDRDSFMASLQGVIMEGGA